MAVTLSRSAESRIASDERKRIRINNKTHKLRNAFRMFAKCPRFTLVLISCNSRSKFRGVCTALEATALTASHRVLPPFQHITTLIMETCNHMHLMPAFRRQKPLTCGSVFGPHMYPIARTAGIDVFTRRGD